MLKTYRQFRDFQIFKRFKNLLGDWWNLDVLVVIKEKDKFFYDSLDLLNNSVVKTLLKSQIFKNYFLSSINNSISKQTPLYPETKRLPWKQTGLNLFIIPLRLEDQPLEAFLVSTGFAPEKPEKLEQALSYLGLSTKAIEQKRKSLKKLSPADEIYVQKMLKILAEEFFALLQEKNRQEKLLKILEYGDRNKTANFIGKSPAIQYVIDVIEKSENHDASVLIEGEKGTGKKLLAQIIHGQSLRSTSPFSFQNCLSLRGKLLELELFGYVKGEFPLRYKGKQSLLEKLKGGTLCLNEVGNTSEKFQKKLLNFLKKSISFSGEELKDQKRGVRIFATTSTDLKSLADQGQFSKELYTLLSTINIKVPPLRQRREDIPFLVEHFLKRKSPMKKKEVSLEALKAFYNYSWPGNIQELESEIDRLFSLSLKDQEVFSDQDLSPHIRNTSNRVVTDLQNGDHSLKEALRSIEKQILFDCLRRNNWNKSKVAKQLRTSRTSIILKVKEYGLSKKKSA